MGLTTVEKGKSLFTNKWFIYRLLIEGLLSKYAIYGVHALVSMIFKNFGGFKMQQKFCARGSSGKV